MRATASTMALLQAVLLLTLLSLPAQAQVGTPAGPVPSGYLEARRAAFLEALDGRPALVTAAAVEGRPWDVPGDFRQANDFFYFTGLTTPNAWLVFNAPTRGRTILYLRPVGADWARWTGSVVGPGSEARELTGLSDVRSTDRLVSDLSGWLVETGADDSTRPVLVSLASPGHRATLEEAGGLSLELGDAGPLVARLRQVKDAEEVRRLRRAVAITGEALKEAIRLAEPGLHEYEVEAAIEYLFRKQGAERPGFASIVASGPNSVVLHYDENHRRTEDGDLMVMDVGAEFGYQTADITRTVPVSGRFSDRQRAIYELVLGAQEAALEELRPGVTIAHLERAARRHLDRESEGLCGRESCAGYFRHGLSHWLGMDVHDVGSYAAPLEPGMVLTVEPGVYLPEEGLGVRIEDDVLVTADGYELLSAPVPRTADEVEALMGRDPRWVRGPGEVDAGLSEGGHR